MCVDCVRLFLQDTGWLTYRCVYGGEMCACYRLLCVVNRMALFARASLGTAARLVRCFVMLCRIHDLSGGCRFLAVMPCAVIKRSTKASLRIVLQRPSSQLNEACPCCSSTLSLELSTWSLRCQVRGGPGVLQLSRYNGSQLTALRC